MMIPTHESPTPLNNGAELCSLITLQAFYEAMNSSADGFNQLLGI
jgi:hypothetical protein